MKIATEFHDDPGVRMTLQYHGWYSAQCQFDRYRTWGACGNRPDFEDEPTVRMFIGDVLAELGYTSIEVSDAMAGLAILQSDVRVNLLITDVGLPGGVNGRQMANVARESRRNLKVMFITGYAENSVFAHGHLSAGMSVLTKPFSIDALKSKIQELMQPS